MKTSDFQFSLKWTFKHLFCVISFYGAWIGLSLVLFAPITATGSLSLPGWSGTRMIPVPVAGLSGWSVESNSGSTGTLGMATNTLDTNVLEFQWNIGTGNWTQARYDFAVPFDASSDDIFGISLHGDGGNIPANTVAIMFADSSGVTYGYAWPGQNNGINQINRWMYNVSVPRSDFSYYWGGTNNTINWAKIKTFWLVVKRPGTGLGGGAGTLLMGNLQCGNAASWPRATNFASISNTPATDYASSNAVWFIRSQQNPSTGLFQSWQEDPSHAAWLYDQATALIVMTRKGLWTNGIPVNAPAIAADKLWAFLEPAQNADGSWARGWNAGTGAVLSSVLWVGDQSWIDIALVQYALKSGHTAAQTAAANNARMLAGLINVQGGITGFPSTEGTVDTWWAMTATQRFSDASKIASYLMSTNVWDPNLQYWYEGLHNPSIALDCATWLSAFARYPAVGEPQRGMAALSFVRKTLLTTSDDETLYGLDGLGPVSVWNEGTGQYVAAGGEDAETFLKMLMDQQTPDGSMPGSPDNWTTDAFGWLTTWHGIAPTAWLYFAINGLPFPPEADIGLRIVSISKDTPGCQVTWQSVTNQTYFVQRATNISTLSGFSTIRSNIMGQAGVTTYIDPSATNGISYFYRVGEQ